MSNEINANTSSSILQKSLAAAANESAKSISKISYGRKSDAIADAAGSLIADEMETQERGSEEASYNAQAGVNLLQTADGDLGAINENLQRIRELTVKAGDASYGEDERNAIKSEIESLSSEINKVADSSSFNSTKLLDGSSKDLTLQTETNSDSDLNSIKIGDSLGSAKAKDLGLPVGDQLAEALSSPEKTAKMLEQVDSAISAVGDRRSNIGAVQNHLESNIESLSITQENMQASKSQIRDVDIAAESAKLAHSQILQQATVSLLAQANQTPANALRLL